MKQKVVFEYLVCHTRYRSLTAVVVLKIILNLNFISINIFKFVTRLFGMCPRMNLISRYTIKNLKPSNTRKLFVCFSLYILNIKI